QPREQQYFGLVLGHCSSDEIIRYADQGSEGTRMPRVSWAYLSQYPVAVPSANIANAFTRLIQPMIDRIQGSVFQNRTLTDLREPLLPRLLSGALRVPDNLLAEETVEMLPSTQDQFVQSVF